jgi:hypothetical protein
MLLGRSVSAPHGQLLVIVEAEHSEPSAARKLIASLRLRIDDAALEGNRVITIARKAITLRSAAWQDISGSSLGLVSDLIVDTLARFAPADANDEKERSTSTRRSRQHSSWRRPACGRPRAC